MFFSLILGTLIHLLGLFISKWFFYLRIKGIVANKRLFFLVNPQLGYDIPTIIGTIVCIFAVGFEYLDYLPTLISIPSIVLFGLLGFLLPIIVWKFNGKTIKFRGALLKNIDSLVFLPMTALCEEVLWRLIFPFFILTQFFDSMVIVILFSSIGFVLLHWSIRGVNVLAYMTLFTFFAWLSFLHSGIVGAAVFHITHNLVIKTFRPVTRKTHLSSPPPASQAEW
ncbi:CPBP family intramembrane metalloprotease [Bacillus swezeyi]|uniref:CPBP family intramembrane metalloprotease n=1 Tax=Bacillus swezeyi TaxID=1925020 RepID=A0A5M8S186_9BACI|nr:CPBP family intramembrane metalloprotease [Bacillus swezeyi]TYS38735.1 CPBP family intramembrane metalloprotease [Bacillus swezeyi]